MDSSSVLPQTLQVWFRLPAWEQVASLVTFQSPHLWLSLGMTWVCT